MADIVSRTDTYEVTAVSSGVIVVRIVAKPLGVFTIQARRDLTAFLETANDRFGARCIVLTGAGASFSVGSNIREFEATAEWIEEARRVETKLNETIERGPVPVIAACNGHTLGGGAVMALACDFRIASKTATFALPEVKLGAMATATGTQRLPMLIGRGQALKLMLTGETISAEEAYKLGIFEELVEPDKLETRAIELAEKIASVSPKAVSASRRSVSAGLRQGYQTGLLIEEEITVPLGLSDDAIEGKAAFVEKRMPNFK